MKNKKPIGPIGPKPVHGNTGNKHAVKSETADTFLHIRVTRKEKHFWLQQAAKSESKLSDYVKKHLPKPPD